jgi:hypothetical protein
MRIAGENSRVSICDQSLRHVQRARPSSAKVCLDLGWMMRIRRCARGSGGAICDRDLVCCRRWWE